MIKSQLVPVITAKELEKVYYIFYGIITEEDVITGESEEVEFFDDIVTLFWNDGCKCTNNPYRKLSLVDEVVLDPEENKEGKIRNQIRDMLREFFRESEYVLIDISI